MKQVPEGMKWDVYSYGFRQAIRAGDTSAKVAMEAEVEFGLREISREFGCDGIDIDNDERVQDIVEVLTDHITDADFIKEDNEENGEEMTA